MNSIKERRYLNNFYIFISGMVLAGIIDGITHLDLLGLKEVSLQVIVLFIECFFMYVVFEVMKLLEMKYIAVNDLNLLLSKMESEGLIGSDTTDMIQKRIKK